VRSALQMLDEHLTVRRVFGEPYERDGVTVIPVAAVYGGGGGGGEKGTDKDAEGSGFGVAARPVGVYVIRAGEVTWQPAFDLNRVALGGQVVALAVISLGRLIVKRRPRKRG
jgi:uncharacterized spore protein YtfJ